MTRPSVEYQALLRVVKMLHEAEAIAVLHGLALPACIWVPRHVFDDVQGQERYVTALDPRVPGRWLKILDGVMVATIHPPLPRAEVPG